MNISSKELAAEQARVDRVIEEIDRQIAKAEEAVEKAHAETRAVEKNYGANTSINRYEIDDIAESRAEIEQQRRLLFQASENEDILKRQLATLKLLKKQPYFGRIDILDPGQTEPESLYIGTASLLNAAGSDFLIYDWRAPISAVYYNGTLGSVTYPTPNGPRTTKLVKKRQFSIVDGKITNLFDTNETVGDELLQAALGQESDQYLQSIVATIQQEQNDLIRNTTSDLLVVQGVAGSGKTSAILQRIAYLLFHSRDSLNADQIVLFSPNQLFSKYISQVLPNLGEKNMRQVTLAGFLRRRFEGLKVETIFDRFEEGQPATAAQRFLESPAMMTAVANYLDQVRTGKRQPAFVDVTFRGVVIYSPIHVQTVPVPHPGASPDHDRLLATKNALIRELKGRIRSEARQDWVAEELDTLSPQELTALRGKHRLEDFRSPEQLTTYLSRRWARRRLRQVYDALYNDYFIDYYSQYQDLLASLPQDWAAAVARDFAQQLEWHRLALVHATPLLYLREEMAGGGINRAFQHVFIDEMQDYSPAMLIYLRHAFPAAKFTILGDSEQALFYPSEEPQALLRRLQDCLAAKRPHLINLRRAYRSTAEITTFAKALLPDGDQIIPFPRHGSAPRLVMTSPAKQLAELVAAIETARRDFATVAVLTVNTAQAKQVTSQLRGKVNALTRLGAGDSSLPTSGVIVLPIYLAKGLEFDAVVVPDASAATLAASDPGILYTMATRAMHALTLVCPGTPSPALTPAARELVTVQLTGQR